MEPIENWKWSVKWFCKNNSNVKLQSWNEIECSMLSAVAMCGREQGIRYREASIKLLVIETSFKLVGKAS